MSDVQNEGPPQETEALAEATVPENATGGLGALAAAAAASPVVTPGADEAPAAPGGSQTGPAPEGGQKFATVEAAGAQSQAAARAFMRGDEKVWENVEALRARAQKWGSTTFLKELLKDKNGATRAEEDVVQLEVGRTVLRACIGEQERAVREMWQLKTVLGQMGELMWAAIDPESLRNSGLEGVGQNSVRAVADAVHGVLKLGGADSGGGLSEGDGAATSFLDPVTTLVKRWAPAEATGGAQVGAAAVVDAVVVVEIKISTWRFRKRKCRESQPV